MAVLCVEAGRLASERDRLGELHARLAALPPADRRLLVDRVSVGALGRRASSCFFFAVDALGDGPDELRVPAMLVPAMLGLSFEGKDAQFDFARYTLRPHGKEGVDWGYLRRAEVFDRVLETHDGVAEVRVPGRDRRLVFRRDCGRSTKFPFLTPRFAFELLVIGRTDVSRAINLISHAVLAELLSSSKGPPRLLSRGVRRGLKRVRDLALRDEGDEGDEGDGGESAHSRACARAAAMLGARREVANGAGVADAEGSDVVVEVKHTRDWMHGLGQALGYGAATSKRPVLALFGGTPHPLCRETCRAAGVSVVLV